jgi:hypothetical protein
MKILAIKRITTKAGKSLVLVQTAGQDVFITAGQWKSAGCSASLDNYVGGNIDARYFEKGEELFDGKECTESGKILDTFSASMNPAVLAHSVVIESQVNESNALSTNALFARKRAERQAKEAVGTPLVD